MYGNCVIDGGLGVMIVAWFDAQGTWTGVQPYRPGYRCSGWNGTFNFAWGPGAQFSPTGSFTEYAQWQANNYTIAFDANGGSGNVPANVSATYDQSHYVAAPTLSKPGYTFDGWATTPGGAKAYEKGGPFKNLTTAVDGTVTLYAHWRENSLKVDANGGELIKQGAWPAGPSTVPSVSTRFNDGWQIEPTVMQVSWWNTDGQWTAVQPTRVGYACTGYAGSVGFTAGQEAISDTAPLDIKALWRACDYALIIRANGGSIDGSSDDLALTVTYDSAANSSLSCRFARTGYAFKGAYTEATGGTQVFGPSGNCTREGTYWSNSSLWCYPGNATLYAQWDPVLSADVPLEVTARVDKLGIEEQAPAAGYIESRCGEPLKVTDVSFAPLPGASELFGAGNESQVRLQALAGQGATWQPGGANASFSFPLDASATESDAGKLAVLTMQAYGERIPISYRFDVPDALLATLAEATTTVCQVAYTVALA